MVLFFIFSSAAHSSNQTFFEDQFNTLSSLVWNVHNNSGGTFIDNGRLILKSPLTKTFSFPYIYNKTELFPNKPEFDIYLKFRYLSSNNFGTAITLSANSVPSNGINPDIDLQNNMTFMIYQDKPNGLSYGKFLCDRYNNNCNTRTFLFPFTHTPDLLEHIIKIRITKELVYEIYIDDLNTPVFTSGINQKLPKYIWFGNSILTNTYDYWSDVEIDYIKVETVNDEVQSYMIIPGFGASWDLSAVLNGDLGADWKIPSFIKEYDGIVNSFKNAGYEENKDLFVFPYDWRKSLDELATDLNNFLADKSLGDKKINLVGHSMGGLVARTYLQKYNNPNVEKVIMAGSPNKGIADAYNIWEGASAGESVWWQKALLEIASEVNRKPGETKIEAVRRVAPSVKDLMPTDNFLISNSTTKPWENMTWKNLYLSQKNIEVTPFLPKLVGGASKDYGSRSAINVENPNEKERLQGLWVDGRPVKNNTYLVSPGDGYVSLNSAQSLFDKKLDFTGGHGETISKKENVIKILSELGVATESAVGSEGDTRKSFFVAKLNSPGRLHVCNLNLCDSALGLVFEPEKLIIIPGYNNEKYSITVESQGETGDYRLLIGEVNENGEWKEAGGKLYTGSQKDNYFYDGQTNALTADSLTVESIQRKFWGKKIKLDEVNDLREKILHDIDKNIKKNEIVEFDLNIFKWKILDLIISSKGIREVDEEKHTERSKYISKSDNYFAATLSELLTEIEFDLIQTPLDKRKLREDKLIQIKMLRAFLGIKNTP